MGKSTISMAIFNGFLYVYQRVTPPWNIVQTDPNLPRSLHQNRRFQRAAQLQGLTTVRQALH